MRRESGAVTLYVSIVCLFVLIIGIAQYVLIANKQAVQLEQLKEIEDVYNSDLTIDEVYNSYGGGDVIEIDTVEKLLKIGSNENLYIDGKIYNFGSKNTYVLLQDFEFEGDFGDVAEAIKDNQILIQGNGHKVVVTNEHGVEEYYTEESKYYIATNKYGYVLKGLELYYDGIDNTGTGEHSFAVTTWKDLSGNGRDGSLVNFGSSVISGWNKNCLSFDGVNDWVSCGELNFDEMTLEATYLSKSRINHPIYILGNWQSGGAGLLVQNYSYLGEVYNNGQYYTMFSDEDYTKKVILTHSLTYNQKEEIMYINGNISNKMSLEGRIEPPNENTVMAIGANPKGNVNPNGGYADIDVYSVRIYSRGLSQEEIELNEKVDNRRFKREEIIPIYTEEQLAKVGSGEEVIVSQENKTYLYSKDGKYELKNDINISGDYTSIISKISNREIEFKLNNHQINNNDKYYTSNSKYTIAVNKYGYVIEGLQLLLDGIDNTGNGHSATTTTWKDLSGKNRNGTLKNMTASSAWESDGLKFDGVDDYVLIAQMNYSRITLETVTAAHNVNDTSQYILNNIDAGGYLIRLTAGNKFTFGVYLTEDKENVYPEVNRQEVTANNQKRSISGSYDGKIIKLRSGTCYEYVNKVGNIGMPINNTYMVIGCNPTGTSAQNTFYKGEVYSVRIYNRAITDEENSVNYLNDRERYAL